MNFCSIFSFILIFYKFSDTQGIEIHDSVLRIGNDYYDWRTGQSMIDCKVICENTDKCKMISYLKHFNTCFFYHQYDFKSLIMVDYGVLLFKLFPFNSDSEKGNSIIIINF